MIPNNFFDFRKLLADVLKVCEAPEVAVEIVADVDCEGGPGFEAIWNCWSNIESDWDFMKQSPDDWGTNVHDAVIELFSDIGNRMNWGPGETPRLRLDVPALARLVEVAFTARLEAA